MAQALSYFTPIDRERSPLVELLLFAGPTVAQMASYTVMQFIDTWMLAHVGPGVNEPTAGSNAGMLAFSVISLGMGVMWVVNTLVSQSFGRKGFRRLRAISCGRGSGLRSLSRCCCCRGCRLSRWRSKTAGHEPLVGWKHLFANHARRVGDEVDLDGLLAIPPGRRSAQCRHGFHRDRHIGQRRGGLGDDLRPSWVRPAWASPGRRGDRMWASFLRCVVVRLRGSAGLRQNTTYTIWKPRMKMFLTLSRVGLPGACKLPPMYWPGRFYDWVMNIFGAK